MAKCFVREMRVNSNEYGTMDAEADVVFLGNPEDVVDAVGYTSMKLVPDNDAEQREAITAQVNNTLKRGCAMREKSMLGKFVEAVMGYDTDKFKWWEAK